jgi:hypothetical protein
MWWIVAPHRGIVRNRVYKIWCKKGDKRVKGRDKVKGGRDCG